MRARFSSNGSPTFRTGGALPGGRVAFRRAEELRSSNFACFS